MPHDSASDPSNPSTQPPIARRDPTSTTLHGITLHDDFSWMREKSSPEVLAYLEAENAYTDALMASTAELQTALYNEMLSHIQETDESVPYRLGDWFYSTRTVEGSQYPIHCRRRATSPELNSAFDPAQPEQVVLDVNQLAQGKPFMDIGAMAVSPDGNLLAYSTDLTGFRQYTLHIRRYDAALRTWADLPDTAERVGSLAWATDSRTLFYSTEDETTKRQDCVFRHILGAPAAEDALVFHEEDERFNLGVSRTRDGLYLLIESGSHTTNEFHFLPADHPTADLNIIAPRVDEQEYYPDHRYTPQTGDLFYIRTNDTGKNFRVVTAPVGMPRRDHWTELVPLDPDQPLEDFDLFQSFAVATRRKRGLPTLEVLRFASEPGATSSAAPSQRVGPESPVLPTFVDLVEIEFPEPTYTASAHINRIFSTDVFRYSYQSLVSPPSVFEYNIARDSETCPIDHSLLLKQQHVPGGFDTSHYASERLWITAPDGALIPVSIVYRRDRFRRIAINPLYLYGYGSYGYPLPVGFSATRLSLLDRGVVMAYAHIRGGGEMGDAWHDAGKMSLKRNTFTDFISAAEQLVARGYGNPGKVAIEGGSAGGLLMGAVVNMRQDLFRVALSHVPFVDVMNTMLDASLPLTVAEYEEWGNPNEPDAFATMLAYSPYDNLDSLKDKPTPAMLVKTSLNDSQVMFWEPLKYIAKLRTLNTGPNPLLLHINMDAGHGGSSGRYDYLKEIAFDYAFLLTQLGVVPSP
jgi:oligopeptidase B